MNTTIFTKEIDKSGTSTTVFVFVVCVLCLIILCSVLWLALRYAKKNSEIKRLRFFQSDRVFVVNYKDQTVDFFDFNNLRKIETISFYDFLQFFSVSEQNNIKSFIISLLNLQFDPVSEDAILSTNLNIAIDKRRILYHAILKCNKVDKEKQMIYLQCIRLMHTPIDNKTNRHNGRSAIHPISVIRKHYDDGKYNKGSLCVIRLVPKSSLASNINRFALRAFVVDTIYTITNNIVSNFYYSDNDVVEVSIIDTRQFNDYQLSRFAFDIGNRLEKFLELKGLNDKFKYFVCCGLIAELPLYYEEAYKKINFLFKSSLEINRQVSIYKDDSGQASLLESTYKLELERIIKNKDFDILYSPIAHIANTRISVNGYLSEINIHTNLLSDWETLFKYAKGFGMILEVLNLFYKKNISTFISQCPKPSNTRLFISIELDGLNEASKIFSQIPRFNEKKIVLVITSKNMIDKEDNEDVLLKIAELKNNDLEFAMKIKRGDYVLKDKTYRMFDYFLVDTALENNVKQDSRSFIKAYGMIKKLLIFNKPIISINALSLQAMELLFKTGIKDYSNEVIAKNSPMLLPLDPKISKKLLTIIK